MSPAGTRGAVRLAALVMLLGVGALLPTPASALEGTSPGQIYAFGENRFGQLGNTTDVGTEDANPTPTLVSLPGASGMVTQVAAGANESLVLTSADQLFAFGYNRFGQLGNTTNNETFEPNPTPMLVSLPGASGPVTQIAAGADQSLVLTSTGQIYAFGYNRFGQLGSATNAGTGEPNPTPILVSLPGASGPVTQIAAGVDHSLVLTSTGQLYAFGENQFGQLGNTTNEKTTEPNPTPTEVSLPGASGAITQIAAGFYYSLALTSTGQLYAFGNNYFGQLGNTTNEKTREPNPTPTEVSLPGASGTITQIAAGAYNSLALTSTGQLYAFGDNRFGQLGNATNAGTGEPNSTPTLVSLPGASGAITQIAAGFGQSLVLTSTGQLYTFGENQFGQLGNDTNVGTEEPNPTPVLVSLPGGGSIDTMAREQDSVHTLIVVADLAVASSSLPAGEVGASYGAQAQAGGGAPPYRWSATGLPPGLAVDQTSGAIFGTPTVAGSYAPTFTVTDDDGIEATAPLTIVIAPARRTCAAHAGRSATVKHTSVLLKLSYTGEGTCAGSLKLVAQVARKRTARGDGKSHRRRKVNSIVIGRAHFSISKGKGKTLRVHLSAKGSSLVRKARRSGLKVTIEGSHIKRGTLVLKRARKTAQRKRRRGPTRVLRRGPGVKMVISSGPVPGHFG